VIHFGHPLEKLVAEALTRANIKWIHEPPLPHTLRRIDFYLPDYNVYIEVKSFYSSKRIHEQLSNVQNSILIVGYKAVEAFICLITKEKVTIEPQL